MWHTMCSSFFAIIPPHFRVCMLLYVVACMYDIFLCYLLLPLVLIIVREVAWHFEWAMYFHHQQPVYSSNEEETSEI